MCLFLGQYHAVLIYCTCAVLSDVWEGYGSSFVLLPHDCFGNSGSFVVLYKFKSNLFYFLNQCPMSIYVVYIQNLPANQRLLNNFLCHVVGVLRLSQFSDSGH